MEKKSKEELIEYFIEILGDNHVLEKYLSIDEIRKRLNENIKEVTYENERSNWGGSFDSSKKIINIDPNQASKLSKFRLIFVHEMLHALSLSEYEDTNLKIIKNGFEINQELRNGHFYDSHKQWTGTIDRTGRNWGKSINEGMTELLTEEILGVSTEKERGYQVEKDVARVLLGIMGKENMLNHYFSKIRNHDKMNHPFEYFFGDILKRNYEVTETKNVPFTIKVLLDNIIQASQFLTIMNYNMGNNLDENQREIYDIHYNDLSSNVRFLTQNALETIKQADDFERKREILEAIFKFHNFEWGMNIDNPELINDVQKVIFDKNKDESLGERIWKYKQVTENGLDFSECGKGIEEYAISNGIINQTSFSKADMLRLVFKYYGEELRYVSDEEMKDILSNFSYKVVDGNCELYYHGIDSQIAKEINSNYFDANNHKRLTDDIVERNIDRKISRFTNSLIGIDDGVSMLKGALHDSHDNLNFEDMLEIIEDIEQTCGYEFDEVFLENLQEFYITKTNFSKHDMLLDIFNLDSLKKIQEFRYQKVGSHYELSKQQDLQNIENLLSFWKEIGIYQEDGTKLYPSNVLVEKLTEEQRTCYFLYHENKELLEKAKQLNQKQSNKFIRIQIVGNDVTFDKMEDGKINSSTYTLNQFGELELVTSEMPRRITDDMSEIDIKLMQETEKAKITVSEMKRSAQDMFSGQIQETFQEKVEEN